MTLSIIHIAYEFDSLFIYLFSIYLNLCWKSRKNTFCCAKRIDLDKINQLIRTFYEEQTSSMMFDDKSKYLIQYQLILGNTLGE